MKVKSLSCRTLCDPMDCSLSGSSVHGIFQARVLEWIAIAFSRGSSRPRNRTRVSHIAGRHFTVWATVHGVAKSWTRLSDFTSLHNGCYSLMATTSFVYQYGRQHFSTIVHNFLWRNGSCLKTHCWSVCQHFKCAYSSEEIFPEESIR